MEGGATSINPSPWAKIQPPKNSVCFADIMSEQLAQDLHVKEEERYVEVFEEPPEEPLPTADSDMSRSPDCDSDEMIALMLQAQFDKEHDVMLKRSEEKFNGSSKVNISYSNYRVMPGNHLSDSDSDNDDDINDKHMVWDSFVSSEKHFKTMPKCGYKKEGDQLVTKHDMEMSSRRNACRVMNFPPEFQTGDGGGFDMQLSNKVYNSLRVHSRHEQARQKRVHDKTEQATAELSVDPHTRLLLFKLLNQEILDKINGVLSTGKEAVVIHADGGLGMESASPKECAIKIFKTTLNEFKTRDKYIEDDFRFKDRFSKQNPRRIIHLWAEKEMHNLIRMHKANIACPEVVTLKKHVLVMAFIGHNHQPAPKLKDAALTFEELTKALEDAFTTIKKLYVEAGLVHADLSEYNILWYNNKCWYIDVSQAVERNHPKALEFLFRDCFNICTFFTKKGLPAVKTPEELFKEVTGIDVPIDGIAALCEIKDFEWNNELLTHDKLEEINSFNTLGHSQKWKRNEASC